MIRISIQVCSETFSLRTMVSAESIQQAIGLTSTRYPGSEVSVLFPIDPDTFFEKEPAPEEESSILEMLEEATG